MRKAPHQDAQGQRPRWVGGLRGGVCLAAELAAPSYPTSRADPRSVLGACVFADLSVASKGRFPFKSLAYEGLAEKTHSTGE